MKPYISNCQGPFIADAQTIGGFSLKEVVRASELGPSENQANEKFVLSGVELLHVKW